MNRKVEPDYSSNSPWGEHEKYLNKLVNNNRINDPKETVYLIKMVEEHDLNDEKEIIRQFNNHQNSKCNICGQHNKGGSFQDRVDMMYEAQEQQFGFKKYSRETCEKYLYDLFTTKTIRGDSYEQKAIKKLTNETDYDYSKATDVEDNEYAIDIIVEDGIAGIQVKPLSYELYDADENLKKMNKYKNSRYENKVLYLIYDDNTGDFININQIINQLD